MNTGIEKGNPATRRVLVVALMVIVFVVGAETAYLFGSVGAGRVSTTTTTLTLTSPSMILQDFTICSANDCGHPYASINGFIVLGYGSSFLVSVHLFVNGTDEGSQQCGAAQACSEDQSTGFVIYSKNLYQSGLITGGKAYRIELVGVFVGNLTSRAATDVVAY